MERLHKLMARCGVASRRKCEEMIKEGRVSVNRITVTQPGSQADPEKDRIAVDGKEIKVPAKKTYIMLNKPDAVVSTAMDPEGRKTVLDCVPFEGRLYPVGRLDYHTQGLILLTDDGDAAYRLTHPKYEIEKEYIAVIKGDITRHELNRLQAGVVIAVPEGEVRTAPAKAAVIGRTEHTATVSVIIHEGRNRQVRRMLEAVGKEVLKLTRVRMGELQLGNLAAGECRELNSVEIAYLNRLK